MFWHWSYSTQWPPLPLPKRLRDAYDISSQILSPCWTSLRKFFQFARVFEPNFQRWEPFLLFGEILSICSVSELMNKGASPNATTFRCEIQYIPGSWRHCHCLCIVDAVLYVFFNCMFWWHKTHFFFEWNPIFSRVLTNQCSIKWIINIFTNPIFICYKIEKLWYLKTLKSEFHALFI